jgi:hypothetical protein
MTADKESASEVAATESEVDKDKYTVQPPRPNLAGITFLPPLTITKRSAQANAMETIRGLKA